MAEGNRQFEVSAVSVSKTFALTDGGQLAVLADLTFSVAGGEIVCLLGTSGCGKTTFLNILASLDADFSGSVTTRPPGERYTTGYMLQNDGLLPWRTVLANVRLGLEFKGLARRAAQEQALETLRAVEMVEFRGAYPAQLSGGMRQRVALARTLAVRPRLLLLDEPLAHLDFVSRRRLAELIRDYVSAAGAAAVVVTHSIEESVLIANRILVLSGRPARLNASFQLAGRSAGLDGDARYGTDGELYQKIIQAYEHPKAERP